MNARIPFQAAMDAYQSGLLPATRLAIDRLLLVDDQDELGAALRTLDMARAGTLADLSEEQVSRACGNISDNVPFTLWMVRRFAIPQ